VKARAEAEAKAKAEAEAKAKAKAAAESISHALTETKPDVPGGAPVPAAPSAPAASVGNRDAAAAVRALRRARARRLGLRVAVGIGLPTLLASVYYFFVASSQYESVSLFTVQSAEARGVMGLETLIGAVPGAAAHDALAVRDFITSRDMLALLERQLNLSEHYADPVSDWWARLTDRSSSEDTYDYYQEMVQVDHDSTSGVLTLRVRAFAPEYAKKVADAVLSESEKMVNHLSERARADQTKVARGEVANAEQRLTKARLAIVKLQQEHAEFNPEQTATEAFALRGELKGELAMARAELMEARAFMQPNAPKVVALEERVRSLSAQVAEESRRLVNPKGDKGLTNSMAEFDAAMVEKEFAQSAYQSALTSLEMARSEASRQHRYLATIAKPSVPNTETHPKRVRGVVTVVLLSAMLLGIVMLLVEAVREHARI
jgi:capsular polysaccharide transport system permease protein